MPRAGQGNRLHLQAGRLLPSSAAQLCGDPMIGQQATGTELAPQYLPPIGVQVDIEERGAALLAPDFDEIRGHLQFLFGGDLGEYGDGLIEIAWTTVQNGVHKLNQAHQYGLDQIDAAAGIALQMNSRGSNVYYGVWLRKPGTFPGGRAKDEDCYATTVVCCDLDDPDRAENAKNIWADLPPSRAVMTGRVPHARMQFYYKLKEPLTDADAYRATEKALSSAFGGDGSIVNPSRVMRLPGSIAHPAKRGRVQEMAHVYVLRRFSGEVDITELQNTYSHFYTAEEPSAPTVTAPAFGNLGEHEGGLGIGAITDGREKYMRDTALACLGQYASDNGAAPSAEELHELAWPQYERNAEASVPGKPTRGSDEMMAMCKHTVARFDARQISSMPDLDAAIAYHRAKKANADAMGQAHSTLNNSYLVTFTPYAWRDPRLIPKREFVYGTHYIRKFDSTTVATGGTGKSSLILVEALAMVTGKNLLGIDPKGMQDPQRVWVWNGEDPAEETERRVAAACKFYGITSDAAGGYWRGVDCGIIDPFVSSHRVSENDNNAIDAVAKEWSRVADECAAAIHLVHHSRKTQGEEVGIEDGRGASSLMDAVRSARAINTMTKNEADKAGITDGRRQHFKSWDGKASMSVLPDSANWYQLTSVSLGNSDTQIGDNSDSVAVAQRWTYPDLLDDVTGADFESAALEIRRGDFRKSTQADDWVGIPIARALGLGDVSKPGHARAKAVALTKMWLASGALKVVDGRDPNSVKRQFVRVAETA